jgi:hypothetical protein
VPNANPLAALGRSCLTVLVMGALILLATSWALYTYARALFGSPRP